MSEEEVRSWLTERLHRNLPDSIWQFLLKVGYIADLEFNIDEEDREEKLDALATMAKGIIKIYNDRPITNKKRESNDIPADIVASIKVLLERSRVFSDYLKDCAERSDLVRRFRKSILNGQTLSPEEARLFLRSPALRFLPVQTFAERGIPFTKHLSSVLEPSIEIDSSGAFIIHGKLAIFWAGNAEQIPFSNKSLMKSEVLPYPQHVTLAMPNELAQHPKLFVGERTAFARLAFSNKILTEQYPWKESDATWFMLTGEAPQVFPIHVETSHWGTTDYRNPRIQITVEPWVPAKLVMKAYCAAQRKQRGRKENHLLSGDSFQLFHFLRKQDLRGNLRDKSNRPNWTELLNRWNSDHQDHRYSNVGSFRNSCLRVWENIVFPSLPKQEENDRKETE